MESDAHILLDGILLQASEPVNEPKILSILALLEFEEKELRDSIDELVAAGLVERSEGEDGTTLLEYDHDKRPPTAVEVPEDFVRSMSRESFLILDIAAHNPRYGLEDIERALDRLPERAEDPTRVHLMPLLRSGTMQLRLGRPRATNLSALYPAVNAAVATQIEPAIRARRATDTEKNRDALLRRLCEKCSLDAQDAIITAYGKVDRTCMLSDEYAPLAWIDAALPIADDATTVSAPHAIVMTLQAVRPAKGEKVLICGCKGGLLGAVAMHMVGETGAVLCIDDTPSIAAHAKESIAKMTDLPCPVDVLQRNDITIGMEGEGAWDDAGALEQRYKEAKAAREKEKYAIDKVRQTVAYPLAKMYWNAVNAVERAERYQLALKVHEILLKYYAICCLIEADQQKCRAPAFCHGVANIVRPALGHWLSIIMGSRESLGVTAFGKILSHDLTRTIKHEAVRTALEQLALTTGTAPPDKISLCSFLDLTTQFRNKPEHGTHLSVQEQGETAQLLLDALRIILLESRLCTELDLVYVEDVQFASKAAGLTARVHRCMGTDRQTLTWNLDTPIDSKAVYLLDNAHHEIARLDPMIVYGQGRHKKPDLFIYVNKGQYLTYFDQDRFPAEQLEQRIDDLVNAYAHVSADSRRRDEFETKFMGALQYCASDGRIDGDEMLKLMSMVRAFGLATNDAAGRIYILDKLKSLNLNVSTP